MSFWNDGSLYSNSKSSVETSLLFMSWLSAPTTMRGVMLSGMTAADLGITRRVNVEIPEGFSGRDEGVRFVSATFAQPLDAAKPRAAPNAGKNCLAKEIRLGSISALLMRGAATEEQAKADGAEPLGLYIHVPFCASSCDFCAFYQVHPTAELVEGFMKCLAAEARLVEWRQPLETVFPLAG